MSGVLLATVPSKVRNFNPNLGQLYLAASLRQAGIDVRLLDLASLYGPRDVDTLVAAIDEQKPEILGFTLYTETALYGYDLIGSLGDESGLCVVAGGPHATAEPAEVLEHGFDVVVLGEGEKTLVDLVRVLRSGGNLSDVAGLAWSDGAGSLQTSPPRALPKDLDVLPSPLEVLDLCERDRYVGQGGAILPPIITSRGCPGRCTFCSNNVSGKRYRFHSAGRVLEEVRGWQAREGATALFFHDTAFTAHRKRTLELCRQLENLSPSISWVCKSRCDQIDRELASAMAAAGCTSVFFGVESGSAAVLERIGKGITIDDIEQSVHVASAAGLGVYVHIMVGFPDETVEELEATCALMERLAPLVKGFPTGGILLPYPGTAIYQSQHERLGCSRWWLDRSRIDCINVPMRGAGGTPPSSIGDIIALHAAIESAFLAAKVVPYSRDVRAAIECCLTFRRAHNRSIMEGHENKGGPAH
jgi:anaerobic magnesium-protoporphyrin IX monomethyl ester cyclase